MEPNVARFLRVDVIGEAGMEEVDVGTCVVGICQQSRTQYIIFHVI